MREVKNFLKKLKSMAYGFYAKYVERKRLLKATRNLIYQFSDEDIDLYITEKFCSLPLLHIVDNSNSLLQQLNINGTNIYWPTITPSTDLPWLYHEIFDDFSINPSSYNHPKIEIHKADWVIDAGCCEGFFTSFVFQNNKTAKVIAFEPLKEMEAPLTATFNNQISENSFSLEQKALDKVEGKTQFNMNNAHLCDSGLDEHAIIDDNDTQIYEVETTTLNSISIKYALRGKGIIKMDIEGAEMDALIGSDELLKKLKPRLAVAVYHKYENALKCKDIILKANPQYKIEFRGCYGYFNPPRPYMLFAW